MSQHIKSKLNIYPSQVCAGICLILNMHIAQAVTSQEQIDRLSEVYGALLDYRPAAIPGPRPKGQIEVSAEVDLVPSINNRIGAKTEQAQISPVIGRARLDWSPLSGLRLGGFLIPPVTVLGSTARLFGLHGEYGWGAENIRSSARIYMTRGSIEGPFSAPDSADQFILNASGMDLRSGWFVENWVIYAGLGQGSNQTQFHIGADSAVIYGSRQYSYALAGIGWVHGPWTLVAEQQHTFNYLSNVIFTVTYGF